MNKIQSCFLILTFSLILIACSNTNEQNQTIELNENWEFTSSIYEDFLPASVPGSVHIDLFNNNLIPDPFFGNNEKNLQWIDTLDWTYINEFPKPLNLKKNDLITFVFKGLDTYAEVYLNNSLLLLANNMFVPWEVTVKEKFLSDKNILKIIFRSPTLREQEYYKKLAYELPGGSRALTRKAAYQYGWDWAPKYITSGIWQSVKMIIWNKAKIENLNYKIEKLDSNIATIILEATIESAETFSGALELSCKNKSVISKTENIKIKKGTFTYNIPLEVKDPELWWTHNLGNPFLYDLDLTLSNKNSLIDKKSLKIGLRSIELIQENDKYGESFFFKLNGVPVFMKGANYVPQSSFPGAVSDNQYKQIISDAKKANMNMLRVWGGGIYEKDIFYDLCDEKGILIWQDFMFANAMYPNDSLFIQNIKAEANFQVKRLRKHPSLAIWCGNNEINEAWHNWAWSDAYSKKDSAEIWDNYKNIFHKILPDIVKENSPNISYTSSSPLFGRGNPRSSYEGDNHYWYVWHDAYDFEWYNKVTGRFMSEFGFQSYPSMEAIEYFDTTEIKTTDSEIMQTHQKHHKGNFLINHYMKDYYPVPDNFKDFVYVSQLLQAEGIRTGILAQRRAKPFCMGSLYWQLNDCWSAISWSGIDYSGNWKALHYFAREDFKNVIINPLINNDTLEVHIVSDSLNSFEAELHFQLIDFNGNIKKEETLPVIIKENESGLYFKRAVQEIINEDSKSNHFISLEIKQNNSILDSKLVYFCKPKSLKLSKFDILTNATHIPEGYLITLRSNQLVKNLYIELPFKGKWSNNFFDLMPGIEKKIIFETELEIENILEKIKYKSLNHILTENKTPIK
jgi:beta-mannosidase